MEFQIKYVMQELCLIEGLNQRTSNSNILFGICYRIHSILEVHSDIILHSPYDAFNFRRLEEL